MVLGFSLPPPLEPIESERRVGAMPDGSDPWRIDWFGPVAFPDRLTRNRQPLVLVYMSRLRAGPIRDPEATDPVAAQRKRWVSVGTTMLLRIGDVWRDRKPYLTPEHTTTTFEGIQIDRSTCSIVKAGSADDLDFLLPLDQHPWHRLNTHSYCTRVDLPDGRVLIIPCMELIRFYFGSSSELLSRLFMPPLRRERLFKRCRFGTGGKMTIQLADNITGASAEDVARIAGDRIAFRAAAGIGTSCLNASSRQQEMYPQATFPFEGATDLQVAGRWLTRGGVRGHTFLVYRIEKCSHPFPFTTLRYELNEFQRPRYARPKPDSPNERKASSPGSRTQKPGKPTLQDADASSALRPETRQTRANRKFTDLEGKPVWGSIALRSTTSAGVMGKPGPPVEDLAVGAPGSQKRIRPVALEEAPDASHPPVAPLRFAALVLDAMARQREVSVDLLTATRDGSNTVGLKLLADDDGVIQEGLLVPDGYGGYRPRQAIAFVLSALDGSRSALSVFVESDPISPLEYPMVGDTDKWLSEAFGRCARDFLECQSETLKPGIRNLSIGLDDPDAAALIAGWVARVFDQP